MKKKTVVILSVVLSLVLLLSLSACGTQKSAEGTPSSYRVNSSEPSESFNGFAAYDMEVAEYDAAPMAAAKTAAGSTSQSSSTSQAGGENTPEIDPEKIIYSGDATLETEHFEETVEAVRKLIAERGGFIESSSLSGSNYYSARLRTASFTLRVPSGTFSEIMNTFSDYGNVPYSHTYTENISARYYDTAARLTAYETQEQRLLEMMEQAETVSDLITIEDRLTELRYEIESLQSTLNRWDRQVSYSSISLEIREVREYTPEVEQSFGEQLVRSLRQGWTNTVEFLKAALLWLLEALPVLVLLAVIVLVARVLIRKWTKKRRERKAKIAEKPAEK